MPKYFYTARDSAGKKITSYEEASTPEEVVARLQGKGLLVLDVSLEYKSPQQQSTSRRKGLFKLARRHNGVTENDIVLFCRQFSTLLSAGVTVLKCLDIIGKQVASNKLLAVIKDMQHSMESGLSLHEAMAKHPAVFNELWVNLTESGEASGNLSTILARLASYLERNAAFKAKVISAMMYPAVLCGAGLAAMLFLTIKIIPTFAALFKGFNIEMPLLTQIVIGFSSFLQKFFIYMFFAGCAGYYFFRKYIKTKPGRRQFETILFKLPLFGDFFRALVVERYSSEMSTLIESGVPILYSLEIAEHSVGNLIMADTIRKVKDNVREGKPLSTPMEESGFFEPMVVQMVAIGEEIGELSSMFKKVNGYYQEYVETFLVRFTSMFEPFMLIVMGSMIGVMVIAIFLPIFKITSIK
jgi:type IV pilus assembly protein PilC